MTMLARDFDTFQSFRSTDPVIVLVTNLEFDSFLSRGPVRACVRACVRVCGGGGGCACVKQ